MPAQQRFPQIKQLIQNLSSQSFQLTSQPVELITMGSRHEWIVYTKSWRLSFVDGGLLYNKTTRLPQEPDLKKEYVVDTFYDFINTKPLTNILKTFI